MLHIACLQACHATHRRAIDQQQRTYVHLKSAALDWLPNSTIRPHQPFLDKRFTISQWAVEIQLVASTSTRNDTHLPRDPVSHLLWRPGRDNRRVRSRLPLRKNIKQKNRLNIRCWKVTDKNLGHLLVSEVVSHSLEGRLGFSTKREDNRQ